ncbi:MAG: Uma2 family endonuclease [Nitrospirae bacterium]|nr:Uma2 family endonuclease [Candidatus Troglogloeales bacterium]
MKTIDLESEISSFDLTEIIEGEEIMSPSPLTIHQKIVLRLLRKISEHTERLNQGEAFVSPLDVIFEEGINRLQPDIIFIKKDNLHIVQDWIRGVPDVLIEVVSEGSVTIDTVKKKAVYERYGVPEFWIVYPSLKTIEIFVLESGKYQLHSFAELQGKVTSKIIGDFELYIDKIFSD